MSCAKWVVTGLIAMQDTIELTVMSVKQATPDVRVYELAAADGGELPSFTAGAHVDLHLSNGMVRSYSILSDPDDRRRYLLGVARDRRSRGGSAHIHDTLEPGDRLNVGLPRNNFELDEDAPASVLIAGGIGITPMMSMVCRLESLGGDWQLHLAARTADHAPFRETLALFGDRAVFHFDDEHGGGVMDIAAIVGLAEDGAHLYCCGPAPMLDAFKRSTAHLPSERVHLEHFASSEPAATEGGFDVELTRSGKTVHVAKGQSILDAVSQAGVAVPFSCQAGVCGSCETRIVEGVPDHRDLILTESERSANKSMMICCSGSFSDRLVLDL